MRIRLITFDVNNTLIRVKRTVGFEYLKTAEIYCNPKLINKSLDRNECENQLSNAFKTVWKDMNKKHPNYGLTNGMSSYDWWSQSVVKTFRSAQYTENQISDKQMDLISNHLFQSYSSGNCWTICENSHKVLSHLKKSEPNIKIGIISNFDERLDQILYELGLRHYFDFVLISRVVKHWKPSKEIFELALKSAEVDKPLEALHIGDDLLLDYLSAKSFGWNALLYKSNQNDFNEEKRSQINRMDIISSFTQLIDHKIFQ